MVATAFTIEIEPIEDTYTPALDWIAGRLVDIAPAYDALYATFRKIEAKRFNAEGPGWAELAPSTVAQRGSDHPILVAPDGRGRRSGQLRRSLTTKGAKGAVVEPLPDGLFMGTDDPLAKVHHKGTDRAGRDHTTKIPARPLIDLTEADAELFGGVLSEYFYGFTATGTLGATEAFEADAMAGI
jgi:phage gpG-like protein